jgi:hypothetical protein
MTPKKAVTKTLTSGIISLPITVLLLIFIIPHLQAPAILSGFTLFLGSIMWIAIMFFDAEKTLEKIGRKDTTVPFANFHLPRALALTFAILSAIIALILLAFYILYYQPFWTFLVNLLIPFQSALYFTPAVCFWRWQRKNNQPLYIVNKKLSLTPT